MTPRPTTTTTTDAPLARTAPGLTLNSLCCHTALSQPLRQVQKPEARGGRAAKAVGEWWQSRSPGDHTLTPCRLHAIRQLPAGQPPLDQVWVYMPTNLGL